MSNRKKIDLGRLARVQARNLVQDSKLRDLTDAEVAARAAADFTDAEVASWRDGEDYQDDLYSSGETDPE